MRRPALIVALLAVLAAAAAAPADALAGREDGRPRVRLADCDVEARSLEVVASLRRVRRAERLAVRFDLERRRGRGGWRRMRGPGLGLYHESDPGVRAFRFRQRIENLPPGARYRVVVRFRWSDADGEVLRRTRRRSRSCEQPETRPDLRVARVARVETGDGERSRYRVLVRNAGGGDAPATDLEVRLDGAPVGERADVPALAPGEATVAEVEGPRCLPGAAVEVVVDPDGRVAEASEDNVRRARCEELAVVR